MTTRGIRWAIEYHHERRKIGLAVCFLVSIMLFLLPSPSLIHSQVPPRVDLSFDDCVATTAFGRDIDVASNYRFEWICSFLMYSSDTGNLQITMSHDKCVYTLLSNLWRLEIVSQIGRNICDSLAYVTERPSILTPEPTRIPQPTRTPRPTTTPVPAVIEVICESEEQSRALIKSLQESGFVAYLRRKTHEGRIGTLAITQYSAKRNLPEIISVNGLDCSIPEQAR